MNSLASIVAALLVVAAPSNPVELVGKKAPSFTLPRLTEGEVSFKELRGKPVILVIGTTEEGAPLCRDWAMPLVKNFKGTDVEVYQVVVLDNPWYIPNAAVKSRLKDFTSESAYDRMLIEWDTKFGEDYGIPRDDLSRLVVIDRKGIVRWTYKGKINDETMIELLALVDTLV